MSDQKINHDKGQPLSPSNSEKNLLVSNTNFASGKIPIYWGPEQETTEGYESPKLKDFKVKTSLQIPSVGRFVFYGSAIDASKYKTPTGTGNNKTYSYCRLVRAVLVFIHDTGCRVYYTYWATMVHQLDGTERRCQNNGLDYNFAYTCYTTDAPSDESCVCRPECNGIGFSGGRPTTDACSCGGGVAIRGQCTNCPSAC